ncbi:origin recognition complex subunit 3 [Asbolus verrucosus]|uniref:Origin recognition complex subunit 3 n=1 Tax=Asbolus verrucosus TaxID=1661398 RepID=A0A482VNA1_ASBVE|nr:origin recognition complex subunit 3 [Asbolus verrucosus]
MASTVSVSKGIFVFKNGAKAASKKSRKKSKVRESPFSDSLWYKSYASLWSKIEAKTQDLNNEMFSSVLSNLVNYIRECYKSPVTEVPAAALLTGINMPDHSAQFKTLKKEVKEHISPHVATLNGEDCQNLKYLVENMINQLIKDENQSSDEDDSDTDTCHIKKSQCNFSLLQSWYEDLYIFTKSESSPKKQKTKSSKKVIVVIIPDFEGFSPKVLQDFILIASSYINVLPFVFVFGVATSLAAVHRSLPCHVSSKVNIQVFNSSPSYAMLEHFSYGNAMALCKRKNINSVLVEFNHDDFENVRRFLSFRKLVESESPENKILLLTDDDYFRKVLKKEIKKITKYIANLHLFLKCLQILVCDLPKAPLGKQVRELYSFAVSSNITESQEYKECFQLLSFQSKEELCSKIKKISGLLANNIETSEWESSEIVEIIGELNVYIEKMNNLTLNKVEEMETEDVVIEQMDRKQLKDKLLSLSKQSKPMNNFEKFRLKVLDFLSEKFRLYLLEPTNFYFHEIFFFNDISVQNHIIGCHRAAIHTALNDPHFYLQCSCCEIANDSIILQSMPDISIVYKLHLECGKMINLYDWLQSFLSIVDPQEIDDDSKPKVDPQLQARFTQAVAELEYLGFIKSSKRKTDHVARLTWGG